MVLVQSHHFCLSEILWNRQCCIASPFSPTQRNGRVRRRSLTPMALFLRYQNSRAATCVAFSGQDLDISVPKKRKVVEHICLLKAKEDISDEEEKNMLDYLYTSQYHMAGIVAISLGRVLNHNPEKYTHAVYMRFQRKEDLPGFYDNPSYLQVLDEHVTPLCHEFLQVDFEAEVEDDMLSIFRKGEEFNSGVEFVLLVAFAESASSGLANEALSFLEKLAIESPSVILQFTRGCNFNTSSKEYTHGIVIRFRSVEAFQIFTGGTEYTDIWRSKFSPSSRKTLSIYYTVDPIGDQIM